MVAAVAYFPLTKTWFHTKFQAPHWLMEQFLPRNDNEIQAKEFLGVLLAYATFNDMLLGQFWTIFCDNTSVHNLVLNGCAGITAGDLNMVAGKLWLSLVKDDIAMHMGRVPSKSNIADDPTRDNMELLIEFGSVEVSPKLPRWMADLWQPFACGEQGIFVF